MAAVQRIECWRALGDNIIETIINKSDEVKELKQKAEARRLKKQLDKLETKSRLRLCLEEPGDDEPISLERSNTAHGRIHVLWVMRLLKDLREEADWQENIYCKTSGAM